MSGAEVLLVNQKELARALGCSINTVRALLDRYADLPVVEKGSNGREYRFDVGAVQAFLKARRDADGAAQQERSELLSQLTLGMDDTAPDSLKTLAPKDRLIAVRTATAEDDLALKRGFLVPTHRIRSELPAAIARWNRSIHATLRQAGRDLNLPEAVTRTLLDRVAETQRHLVRDLRAYADSAAADAPPIAAEPELRFG